MADDGPYVKVNVDSEGHCVTGVAGMSHPAVRGAEEESSFRPRVADMAPRGGAWAKQGSNTQTPHRA